ncbi:MAG: NUDIX hydrolase N-terminal domain-containing protein [Bacteroidales bacterium]|nr:NUDIX hydrolase N-terminal domain-containing protein [Bacteroidales bacterium]
MKPENEILRIARRIQALAQAGLHYAEDEFDRQRYEELRDLSVQLAATAADKPINKIRDLYK